LNFTIPTPLPSDIHRAKKFFGKTEMQMFASTVQFSNFGKWWGTHLCQYVDENPTGNASIERHGVGTTTSVAAAGGVGARS
jgi:hypothetical protein